MQGRSQTFQNEGAARGAEGWAGGLTGSYWDSKWWLSIDLCTNLCNFIWGARGGQSFCQRGRLPPCPPRGGGKARFNVATPTYEARTRPLHVQHTYYSFIHSFFILYQYNVLVSLEVQISYNNNNDSINHNYSNIIRVWLVSTKLE